MRYLSLFSGIGGFELGIQQAYEDNSIIQHSTEQGRKRTGIQSEGDSTNSKSSNWVGEPTCIGFSEIDKYAIQIYEKHFKHKNYGDITTINTKQLPDFDLLVGGFPCQSFSIAGKRKGFDDTRGTLFFDIARICAEKRPRYLLLENVKGLLSHDKGKTFQTILGVLADLGYSVEWQVLNSKNFGVPQNRERVFIIGYLGGFPRRKVFPIGENTEQTTRKTKRKIKPSARGFGASGSLVDKDDITPTLTTSMGTGGNNIPMVKEDSFARMPIQDGDREISRTLLARDYKDPKVVRVPTNTKSRVVKSNAQTLQAGAIPGILDTRIRKLTPKECERLQGFPDNWTSKGINGDISDTQRYKTLGNAVTVNVIREIFNKLI